MRLVLTLLALLAGAPAGAQIVSREPGRPPEPAGPPNPYIGDSSTPGPGTWREIVDIRERIEDGRDEGSISRREGRRARGEASQIGVLSDRFASDGVSMSEQRELDTRAYLLRDQVNNARLGGGAAAKR